jgi:hypothetical protein
VILAWPLVARLEYIGPNEFADVVPSDVVYHVDGLFITGDDANLLCHIIFGNELFPEFGTFLTRYVECELLIMGAGLARLSVGAIVRTAACDNRLGGAFPLTAHVRIAAGILRHRHR